MVKKQVKKKKKSPLKRVAVKKMAPKKPMSLKKSFKPNQKLPPFANLEKFTKQLELMKEDLLKTIDRKKEEVSPEIEVGDEADVAVRSLARDLTFELTGNERYILEEVEAALRRIEKGTFGYCEGTRKKITMARLKAIPYARYCLEYQTSFEKV